MPENLSNVSSDQESTIELTKEQIKEIREKRAGWYNDQMTYLEPQLKYQRMVAEIEQLKALAAESQFKQAQIYLSLKAESTATEENEPENTGPEGKENG
jgi:hypothetical protein